MEQYVIKGGTPLVGEVTIAGAKNAALGILAAAVMTDKECIIENVPNVRDTKVLLQAIREIGATVRYIDEHTVSICGGTITNIDSLCVDDEFIRKIRASYYLLGALLGKYRRSQVALPGIRCRGRDRWRNDHCQCRSVDRKAYLSGYRQCRCNH